MSGEFFESGSDSSELLESGEEIFDEMARFVAIFIESAGIQSVSARWNHRFCALGLDDLDQRIGVIAFVRNDGLGVWCLAE